MWIFKKKTTEKPINNKGRVGIHINPHGISQVYIEYKDNSKPIIKFCRFDACNSPLLYEKNIKEFCQQNSLDGTPTNFVLFDDDYQLSLFEAPNVSESELAQSMRWLVRDNLSYSIDEAEVDAFLLPLPREPDNAHMAYICTVRKSLANSIKNLVNQSGLILDVIDIPELAFKNITSLHESDKNGGLFLKLNRYGGQLIFTKDRLINLTRKLEINLEEFIISSVGRDDILEKLGLEIQRSIDYCLNMFRTLIISSIVIMPSEIKLDAIQDYLKSALGLTVTIMHLNKYVDFENTIQNANDLEIKCLMAIGGALRDFDYAAKN